jgi:hypothetical protein
MSTMRSPFRALFRALLPAWLAAAACAQVDLRGAHVSPFRAMRAVEAGIEVQVDSDTWFALEAVHGVDTAELLRESRRPCGELWWKRVTEDLPALLGAMGHPIDGDAVDLELRDLRTGDVTQRRALPMTKANRDRLRDANAGRRRGPVSPAPAAVLAAADARADLEALRRLLDERFAYRELRKVDLDALLAAAAQRLGDGDVRREALAREVDRVLRAFGDGHSRLRGSRGAEGTQFLPFLVQGTKRGLAAFRADRGGLLDEERPFVESIDGVPIARWLGAAAERATAGSAAMVSREAERGLRDLADLREALGLAAVPQVCVVLRGPAGSREHVLDTFPQRAAYGEWPRTSTRLLDGGIGYLRLPEMRDDAGFLDGIDEAMTAFRGTRGLIVDVRGNGGGTRDALRRLLPYLLAPNDPPQVGNVAVVLSRGDDGPAPKDGMLADRGMYPADWDGWTGPQRAAIARFAKTFKPSWKPSPGKFGPWHFLVLDRGDNVRAFHYGAPVVVLIDGGCFSATDVFVAVLGTRPSVRLVGAPTSGGSGRARAFTLPKSGIELQLSSMASFRPDGVLFEGNGVPPDVVCEPVPTDFVGATDTALQQAIELLR